MAVHCQGFQAYNSYAPYFAIKLAFKQQLGGMLLQTIGRGRRRVILLHAEVGPPHR